MNRKTSHFDIQKTRKPKPDTNPAPSLNGHINKLLPAHDIETAIELKVQTLITKLLNENSPLSIALELLFLYGVRVSEALSFTSADITKTGAIRIKAKKGSQNRICQLVQTASLCLKLRETPNAPLKGYSRQYVWRLFKAHAIELQLSGHNNKRVTHIFRHIRISDTQEQFKDIKQTQSHYGHKSTKSTEQYTGIEKKVFGNITRS